MKVIVVQGAGSADDVPGIDQLASDAELRFAPTTEDLRAALIGAEVVFGWDFATAGLRTAWDCARSLRWIHWSGAGVDAVLFPELVASGVILTNARGVFDRAMAEYVLGLIIAFAKRFPETFVLQSQHKWKHRLSERVAGQRALVVGVGSIGREISGLLRGAGLRVTGMGRTARADDPDFGRVHGRDELNNLLAEADYVVVVAPLTGETEHMFGPAQFRAMKPTARLINVGRGALVDETALVAALEGNEIAGAALDVFEAEPLSKNSPLWDLPGVIVSPHMSGDFLGHSRIAVDLFVENFRRYGAGEPLLNVVDKALGYVPTCAHNAATPNGDRGVR